MWPPVTFDYTAWAALFPQFSSIAEATVTLYFGLAQQYVDNSDCSCIPNDPPAYQRQTLLWLATAHLTKLFAGDNSGPASPLVGRVNSATEGSVSVGTDMPTDPGAGWWQQTQYGAAFWAAAGMQRKGRYYPGRAWPPLPVSWAPAWGRY